MDMVVIPIQQAATGQHIKQLMKASGYSVKDIQQAMGFENPQAVYKWLKGKSLPSLDNILVLSKLFGVTINDILVCDEDVFILYTQLSHLPSRCRCLIFQAN